VFCQGDPLPLDFLDKKLLIGERLGELPEGLPSLPLQQDIDATQRRLRLKPAASADSLELDLREDGGRARSVFLHRLLALQITWGKRCRRVGKGTFKEGWVLQWKPELAVSIIDASAFGNTVETAAARRLVSELPDDAGLAPITDRLDLALLGSLPEAVDILLRRLDAAAATSHDISELLATVPSLARIAVAGDVRATDSKAVGHLLDVFAARIHAGLVAAASAINEEAANHLAGAIREYSGALTMLEAADLTHEFQQTLLEMTESESVHPMLAGQAVRILRDGSHLDDITVARHLGFALSPGMPALSAAAWLQGFLQGGGGLLVYDRALLALVDSWLSSLSGEAFQATLPLLRRTFGSFSPAERTRIAESVAHGTDRSPAAPTPLDLDLARARPALTAVAKLLGLPQPL